MAKKPTGTPAGPRSSGNRATARRARATLSREAGALRKGMGRAEDPASEPRYGQNFGAGFPNIELGYWKMKKAMKGK